MSCGTSSWSAHGWVTMAPMPTTSASAAATRKGIHPRRPADCLERMSIGVVVGGTSGGRGRTWEMPASTEVRRLSGAATAEVSLISEPASRSESTSERHVAQSER